MQSNRPNSSQTLLQFSLWGSVPYHSHRTLSLHCLALRPFPPASQVSCWDISCEEELHSTSLRQSQGFSRKYIYSSLSPILLLLINCPYVQLAPLSRKKHTYTTSSIRAPHITLEPELLIEISASKGQNAIPRTDGSGLRLGPSSAHSFCERQVLSRRLRRRLW